MIMFRYLYTSMMLHTLTGVLVTYMTFSVVELKILHENMFNSILDSKRWLSHKHKFAHQQGNMGFFCIIPFKIINYILY